MEPFTITVEVVPPVGPDPEPILTALERLVELTFDGFSVATNPIAKPRMSALAMCVLIQERTGRPATLHCTRRQLTWTGTHHKASCDAA